MSAFSGYAPFSPEQLADPFPIYARARLEAPVFYSEELGSWVLTKYQDVRFVYEHPEIFSNVDVLSSRSGMPAAIVAEFPGWIPPFAKQVVMTDPPQHTRLKRLMMKVFTPGRVAQFEPWIREIVQGLIGSFAAAGRADLVTAFTALVPTDVIGRVLGVPTGDSRQFRGWVGDIVTLAGTWDLTEQEQIQAWRGIRQFDDYVKNLVAERRRHRREDVVSYLIEAKSDDGSPALSDEEVVHNVLNIAAAGADTTGNLIALTIYLLLVQPERWHAVQGNRALIGNAVEETMRYQSVVRGLIRRTMRPIELRGVEIPTGELVYIALVAANCDEEVFAQPNVYDMNRPGVRNHMGFGMGAHTCLGASLARLECKVALAGLLDSLPKLTLAAGQGRLDFKKSNLIPGIRSLHATW
jgi:cytochrome P450